MPHEWRNDIKIGFVGKQEMNKKVKSLKNLIYSILSLLVVVASGLLLPRLFMVNYGSEVNGLLSSLTQLLTYMELFEAGVGAATLQALYRPVAESDWNAISRIIAAAGKYYRKTGRWYLITLIAASLVFPLVIDSSLSYWTIAGAVFFSGIGNVLLFYLQGKYRFLLQAEGRAYITANLTTVVKLLTSILKIVLIQFGFNIAIILLLAFFLQLINVGYILYYVRKKYPKLDRKAEPEERAIAQKGYALIHQISSLIFNNTDVLILTAFCGLKVASVYSVYQLVVSHLGQLVTIPLSSIGFAMGQTYQTDKKRFVARMDIVETYFSALIYGAFSVCLFLYIPFIERYTSGITDIQYVDSRIAIMMVCVSVLTLSRGVCQQAIEYAGHFRQTIGRSIAESVVNLTVSLLGVRLWGIYGVLLGTIAALLYRTNDVIIYANVKLLERMPWKTYFIYAVDIALFLGTQWLMRTVISVEEGWGGFILAGIKSCVLVLPIFLIGQTLLQKNCRKWLQYQIQKRVRLIQNRQ